MMYSQFLRDVLTSRPALCHAILAFNGLGGALPLAGPADSTVSLHQRQENSPPLPPALVASLSATPSLCAALQRASTTLTPTARFFGDFAQESRRLALLPPAVLERLRLVFGVAAHAQHLSQIVVRSQQMLLRQEWGDELLDYALQRGRFQIRQAPNSAPGDVPSHTVPRTQADLHAALSTRIREYGAWALHRLSADWPEALRRPSADRPFFATPPTPARNAWNYPGLWKDVKKILLKEVAPAWTPCFD